MEFKYLKLFILKVFLAYIIANINNMIALNCFLHLKVKFPKIIMILDHLIFMQYQKFGCHKSSQLLQDPHVNYLI